MKKDTAPRDKIVRPFFLFSGTAFLLSMFFLTILLLANLTNQGLASEFSAFSIAFAMASLYSILLLIFGWIVYGAYKASFLPFLLIFVVFLLSVLLLSWKDISWESLIYYLTGLWLNSTSKLVLSIIGIVITFLSSVYFYKWLLDDAENAKPTRQTATTLDYNEESIKLRVQVIASIRENAIQIFFPKEQWDFPAKSEVLFGYDPNESNFVFINKDASHIINGNDVVFIDYEEQPHTTHLDYMTDKTRARLIKFYYLVGSNREKIVSFIQYYSNDNSDKSCSLRYLQQRSITGAYSKEEIAFRRKIRQIAAMLDKEKHPLRPFVNDDWFQLLKECMVNIKNSKNNGYLLFRRSVIENTTYLGDNNLTSIISDLSKKPPVTRSAKTAAKQLCFPILNAKIFKK